MRFFRGLTNWTVLCLLIGGGALDAVCQFDSFHDSRRQRDHEMVQEYINSKRMTPFCDKSPPLVIYGNIRFEWYYRTEKRLGVPVRGCSIGAKDSKGIPIPRQTSDVQMNFRIKYKTDRTWLRSRINYYNNSGIFKTFNSCKDAPQGLHGSGTCNRLAVKDMIFGYELWKCGKHHRSELEIGRTHLYRIFDSRIEFGQRFDGITLKYSRIFEPDWKIYTKWGAFVVDERSDHYAWVTESGVLDLVETGIDAKYSFIDWKSLNGCGFRNRCGTKNPIGARYQVSQIALAYNFKPKKVRAYGAFLINHAATRRPLTRNMLANLAWYAGCIMGEVKKAGDWSFDVNYQYVEAQAIPESDVHGMGRGNILKDNFERNGRGKSNYKGWHAEFLYAITDKLSIDATFDVAEAANRNIGGAHRYSKTEIDFIVAF